MRGTFLDISKTFKACDKVWHKGLIFGLKTYGVDVNPLKPSQLAITCSKWIIEILEQDMEYVQS